MAIEHLDPFEVIEKTRNPKRDVAVVGLLDEHERVLLVRTKRLPNHWQPIGGGMEPSDSTNLDTVIRELKEETSLELTSVDLKPQLTANYDFGDGIVYFYTASLPPGKPIIWNTAEVLEWKWFTLDEALNLKVFPATKRFLLHLSEGLFHVKVTI